MQRYLTTLLMLLVGWTDLPAQAGSQAGGGELTLEHAARAGKHLEQTLATRGARVAIVARVGRSRDQLPEGIRYTHVAYAVYSTIQLADGTQVPGYSFYNLYQLEEQPDRSHLVTDFATDFYLGAVMPETGVLIPKPELQRRLFKVIGSETYRRLHIPSYSVIANPYHLSRQNCAELVLDILQAALYEGRDHQRIKTNLKAYFEAQPVAISPIELLLGSLGAPDVTLVDHQGGAIQTTTFGSLGRYLAKYELLGEGFEIREDGAAVPIDLVIRTVD